nr:hypothetical protein UECTKLIX_UECTKLIX_CDS_0008 [Microvirus sp.]
MHICAFSLVRPAYFRSLNIIEILFNLVYDSSTDKV